MARLALFVDLDGTVRTTKTGRPHPVKAWDQRVRTGVKEKLAEYKQKGYAIVGADSSTEMLFNLQEKCPNIEAIESNGIDLIAGKIRAKLQQELADARR